MGYLGAYFKAKLMTFEQRLLWLLSRVLTVFTRQIYQKPHLQKNLPSLCPILDILLNTYDGF